MRSSITPRLRDPGDLLLQRRRHAGVLLLDLVEHQTDGPVTQLVRIPPCCSRFSTLQRTGSLHKPGAIQVLWLRDCASDPKAAH